MQQTNRQAMKPIKRVFRRILELIVPIKQEDDTVKKEQLEAKNEEKRLLQFIRNQWKCWKIKSRSSPTKLIKKIKS